MKLYDYTDHTPKQHMRIIHKGIFFKIIKKLNFVYDILQFYEHHLIHNLNISVKMVSETQFMATCSDAFLMY